MAIQKPAVKKPAAKPGAPAAKATAGAGAAAAAGGGGVSLRPSDAVVGGGLHDDFDGTIVDARFVEFDYDGTVDPPVLAICLEIHNDEAEDSEEGVKNPFQENYSAGPIANFTPSDDGFEAIPAGSKTGLSQNCNAVLLLTSFCEAHPDGENFLGSSIEPLVGTRWHFKRAPYKPKDDEDKGLNKKGYKKQGPIVAETFLPEAAPAVAAGAKKPVAKPSATAKSAGTGSSPKPTAKPAPKPVAKPPVEVEPAAAEAEAADAETLALTYIAEQLEAGGGGVEKDVLPKNVFKFAKANSVDNETRANILEFIGNEDWLNAQDSLFTFDGENLVGV